MAELRLVLVTPETTLLDEPVTSLRFPLFDGQFGVLPGRAPAVGRLGYGELRLKGADGEGSWYIEGGFVQIKGPVVSILTNRALSADEIDSDDAQRQLAEAQALTATGDDTQFVVKERELERTRQLVAVASKPR